MKDEPSPMGVAEDEEFISLEFEDEKPPTKEKRTRHSRKETKKPESEVVVERVEQPIVVAEMGGVHEVTWPLTGMDCPDCATKATRALNNLDQVVQCTVSATEGTVKLEVDLDNGPLSKANDVLRSLGHAPDLEHRMLVGVKAKEVAARHGLDLRRLPRLLRRQPGVLDAEIDEDRILLQIVNSGNEEMSKARDDALFEITGVPVRMKLTESNRLRPDQWRLVGAGIAIPLLILAFIGEGMSFPEPVMMVIGITGIFAGGIRMFMEAFASIRNKQLGFQVLTSLAVIGAAILQAWSEALLVVVLVAITEHMEGDALKRARDAMQGGLDRLPRTARRVGKAKPDLSKARITVGSSLMMASPAISSHDDGPEEIPIDLIQVGDLVEIRSGELIPIDGTITEGSGSLDMAPLTGESVPVDVKEGSELNAGLILARGPVVVRVSATGDNTRLSGLIDAVHSFRDEPPRMQSTIEAFTMLWIPLVLIGAPLTWLLAGDPSDWKIMLLLWVVACPCALLLAAPVPHAASLARMSHRGIIARGGMVLEGLSGINLALLDKTGTLTTGKPRIGPIIMAPGRRRDSALRLAAGIEARSNHPYALAVRQTCEDEGLNATTVNNLKDIEAGVSGTVRSEAVSFVRPDDIDLPENMAKGLKDARKEGHGVSLLIRENAPVALFTFIHDDTRDGSEVLLSDLTKMGIQVEIISGDDQAAVDAFADGIGLDKRHARGEMNPEDKVRWVKGRSETHRTLMAGDGFNDAASLAAADVGVAIGVGESINLEAADVLIPADDPTQITEMVALARRTKLIVLQNIAISVIVTGILVWSVVSGVNDVLWIGVLVHELSALLIILNGARLAGERGMLTMLAEISNSLINDIRDSFGVLFKRFQTSISAN